MASRESTKLIVADNNVSDLGNVVMKWFKITLAVSDNDVATAQVDGRLIDETNPENSIFGLAQPYDAVTFSDGVLSITANGAWTTMPTTFGVLCKK